ncbi:hypothetical protein LINGRAHAP2_LOCUS36408 [Linum grandiflorum]
MSPYQWWLIISMSTFAFPLPRWKIVPMGLGLPRR